MYWSLCFLDGSCKLVWGGSSRTDMITIVGVVKRQVCVAVEYVPSVRVYDITTSEMSDDCIRYRVAQNAGFWLTQEGIFAEIECTYIPKVKYPMCMVPDAVPARVGCPILDIKQEDGPLWVETHDTALTIWLAEGRVVDQQYVMAENLRLLASQGELVGIAATLTHIIVYDTRSE